MTGSHIVFNVFGLRETVGDFPSIVLLSHRDSRRCSFQFLSSHQAQAWRGFDFTFNESAV